MNLNVITIEEVLDIARTQKSKICSSSLDISRGDIFVVQPPTVQDGLTLHTQTGSKAVSNGLSAVPERNTNPLSLYPVGGEQYLTGAIKSGAEIIVCPKAHMALLDFIIQTNPLFSRVKVSIQEDTRTTLGKLAAAYYGTENKCPKIIGVTGTNGKTTSTYILENLFASLGHKVGVIGTVSYRWPSFFQDAPLTTPGCLQLHEMFSKMNEAGVDIAFMEVSSHALEQNRIAGLSFSGSLLTNMTQDHLDYHHSMENYYNAKARFFKSHKQGGVPYSSKKRVINMDNSYGKRLIEECTSNFLSTEERPIGFSFNGIEVEGARNMSCKVESMSRAGLELSMSFEGRSWRLKSRLIGVFNAYNLAGVQAMALALGVEPEKFSSLESFSGVSGRMERIGQDCSKNIFVDYAHTPDALTNVLKTLKESKFERVVTVFGCGGNRDKTKRPQMGASVAQYSDIAILTSDNPRNESPIAIMDDVMPGLENCPEVFRIENRREAIMKGIELTGPEDALLIAGKGHETYQIIGEERLPFSDQAVIMENLPC